MRSSGSVSACFTTSMSGDLQVLHLSVAARYVLESNLRPTKVRRRYLHGPDQAIYWFSGFVLEWM